jgi:hypothetical protein
MIETIFYWLAVFGFVFSGLCWISYGYRELYDRANWHGISLILFYLMLKGWDA